VALPDLVCGNAEPREAARISAAPFFSPFLSPPGAQHAPGSSFS